jgi:SRSO17 transposase
VLSAPTSSPPSPPVAPSPCESSRICIELPSGIKLRIDAGVDTDALARVLAIAAQLPFAWVAADSVYGVGDVEQALRRAGKGYVLGVGSNHHFGSWHGKPAVAGRADEIVQSFDPAAWQRLSAGDGTKGARLHDWIYCELADLDASEYDESRSGLWTRGLLVRRVARQSG